MEGDKKKKSGTVQDKRFQHVHTDPRFQRAAKSERKFKPDARFQSMFTDKKFNENYKVDAWGRKIETGTNTSELLKYYDMDEETKAALTKKSNAGGKKAAGAKGGKKSAAKGDDDDESVAPVADKKSSKKSKSKPAPPADDDEEDYDDDDDGEQGFDGNYMSDRMMAPPSSEEEGEDGEEDDEEDEAADEDDDDEEDVDGDVADDDAPSTSSEEDEDDVEMEVVPEEEEIPIGEETSRRLAVMNLEWDRLSSVDLLVLFRSFVPQVAGSLHHPIKCVKVYPSEFGRQRMADEAKYGPTNIYAGGMTPEEYKKRLDEKMSRVKVTNYESDEEEDAAHKVEEEDESERSDESEDELDTTTKSKKKRVSFPVGTKNSKKPSKTVAATPAKQRKASKVKDEFDEAEDDILAQPAMDGSDAEDGDDSDNDSHGSEDSGAEFDPDKLRQYELERLKYYYAIVECDTPATAEALYRSCDGLEFEHSSNLIDLRYVPDDVSFDEDEPFIRDQCSKVPTNYKAPEFYTQALQHTKVQLTWDRDDPTRHKLLSKKFKQEDEALQDLKAYLGSDGEEDGYGSDALTEASDSGSDENENEEVEEEADEDRTGKPAKKKKVTLKRKARSKYLALLQELKAPTDDGDENGDDENREVTITFEPGLKAKGEEIAAKALNKSNQVEESTWEKHLRERLEKKKAKKKARKEKLKALNQGADGDADADARDEDDSGDEIGGANAKIESDLYEDDEVEYDPNDDFFKLSDEDEFEPSKKGKSGRKSAIVSDDDDDDDGDEDEIEMSSESDENGPSEDDEGDDDGEDDIDAFHGKEKAKRFFDDSAPKAKAKSASEKEKPTKKLDKKRKRTEDDEEEDVADKSQSAAAVRAAREKEQAELDLLMMDEDDSNDAGQKGYSLQTLLKQKKASQQAEAGGKKKRRKGATGGDLAPVDDFAVDTKDERFSALFSDAAFSIDPTHPAFKSTEGTDQLLHEKARRRQEQEKEQAKEIARRKEQAKQAATANKHKFGRVDNTPIGAAVSVSESAAAASTPASTSTSSSLASLVASVKRKTAAVNESKKNAAKVVPVGKNTAPASKRSKPDANMN